LAKGGFGEVSKAKWIGHYYEEYGEYSDVVLKRLYNSSDNILDILKEVKKKVNAIIIIGLLSLKREREFKGYYLNFFFLVKSKYRN